MTTPTLVNPQGVLNNGTSVLLATYYNNTAYAFTSDGEFVDISSITSTVVPFTMKVVGDSVILSNGSYSLYYSNSGVVTYGTSGTNNKVFLSDDFFQPLSSGITSGILYFSSGTISNGTTLFPLSFSVAGVDVELKVSLLPAQYYSNCTSPTQNTQQTNSLQILTMYAHSYNASKYPTTLVGWTTQQQCYQGNQFNYCVAGTVCTGNCFSACGEGQTCTYKNNGSYVCQVPPPIIVVKKEPADPHKSCLWIVFLIIGLIVIGLMFWYIFSYEEDSEKETVVQYHHDNYTL